MPCSRAIAGTEKRVSATRLLLTTGWPTFNV